MAQTSLRVSLLKMTPNPEEVVAMAAKLCYSAADLAALEEGVQKKDQSVFIERLMGMGHMSPIEHVSFTFGIEGVSRSLLAQITRHRLASFSVQSQRYVAAYHPEGDVTFDYVVPESIAALGKEAEDKFHSQMRTMQTWYNEWIDALGGPKESSNEDARFVLPNAAATKMMLTMNARELMHFFSLRCCGRAQWEIRALAWEMLKLVKAEAPTLFAKAGPDCVSLGRCPEGPKSCGRVLEMKEKAASL